MLLAFPYWHLQSPIYISYLAVAPCERPGWIKVSLWLYVTPWTGRQAEDLNPCLEQSRSQAAGKLSSVSPSASQLSPLSYLGDQAWWHVMVDIIALSSIYLFPLWVGSNQMKWGDTQREHELSLSKSPMISVSRPEANVSLAAVRQYFVGISGNVFSSPTYIW